MELELRERRIERHLYEQDMLHADAEASICKFDSRLRQLQRERIRIQEKNQQLELHLYQLHQEMNVLNRFEAQEDKLAERVYDKLTQVRGIQDQIVDCEQRIEEHEAEKVNLDLKCQEIQGQFKKLVQDNKFADFLRRIFKKKYRPPKDHDDDESSESESSSSSSEEEDEASLDSRDIGPIRLDPNICPEGCEPIIFNKTYELRDTRHKYEQEMIQQDHYIEMLYKDINAHNKVKNKMSAQLDKRKNDLREFMMEKQSCMNEVTQVVVLRYDQIRSSALRDCDGPDGLSNTVVFPEQLLARLRRRVIELQDEIKQQKEIHKVNRTHLFRMNIDLRAMEAKEQELRAKMRDVLTRKLGRPRRVDRTLDDLLRQMARRHKFSATQGALQQIFDQIREWQVRHSDLEQKYLKTLTHYSERLRVAAALQADDVPEKPRKEASMVGGYDIEHYKRDIVRLRIVCSQQKEQIAQLSKEIQALRLKPLSDLPPIPTTPPESDMSDIYLYMVPRSEVPKKKYFPMYLLFDSAPLIVSQINTDDDVSIIKLIFDCLDAMRVSRDDANKLLKDLATQLPDVISGSKSRYEVVDNLVQKWLLRYGGDPKQYKKQTRAFDALAALADRIIRQHVETLEGSPLQTTHIMESLEEALRDIADEKQPLHERLGPALAALLHSADIADIETDEAMTSLINALIDENHPITKESFDRIDTSNVIADIKDCGVLAPSEEIEHIVNVAIKCLQAQLEDPDEARSIEQEVEKAMSIDLATITAETKPHQADDDKENV
ncbi:hypothetical protein ACJJTC_011602 [Scirpophaga incertulas]